MEKPLDIQFDMEKAFQASMAFVFNKYINNYAVERVAFGFEKPGDQVPIDLYIKVIPSDISTLSNRRRAVPGVYIDEDECIRTNQDYAEYVRDLFVYQMEKIFFDAPKDINLEREAEEIPLSPPFRDYVFGLLPLFTDILKVEVEYDVFDIIPTNCKVRSAEYIKWHRFVIAILFKQIESGCKVNRYVKRFAAAPFYINRLIEKKGKNFYLKQIDINGYEYIFALFSLMQFINSENDKLLELKMREWELRQAVTRVFVKG